MSIRKKFKEKYSEGIKLLKLMGFDDDEIDSKLTGVEEIEGWKPITLRELKKMSESQLKELKCVCWHEGYFRCSSVGITNLSIKENGGEYFVSFSDDAGDPSFYCYDEKHKMDKCGDFEWMYGLYKKAK